MKDKLAIRFIQNWVPVMGEYHVAFSGGKDSVVVYDLVQRSGMPHKAYFCMTTIDPPELLKFIKKNYPEVIWLRPPKSMYQLIQDKGLPTRLARFCCKDLKEYAGEGENVITGIRAEESYNRTKRNKREKSYDGKKMFVNPILDWLEWEIWEYIEKYNLPVCELYDKGYTRLGCVGCPMAYYKTRQKELNRYPKFKNMYLKAIRKRMEKGFFKKFKDEHDVYNWWVGNLSMDEYLRQYKIDFKNK